MPRSVNEKDNVHLVQELAEVDGPFESPINLNFRDFIKLELPSLTWNNADVPPKRMKMTNTGHTVIINGKWKSERPSLSGGPLTGKYLFSQIHFHWGPDDSNGSEHQISGESFPMEMHVAHFKSEYLTQEAALREKDGIVVLVYLFKIQDKPNTSLKKIISFLPCIRQPNSCRLLDYSSILAICNPFTDDYFMYWGSVVTSTCAHILLWIVCREPFGISKEQLNEFRNLLDASMSPIRRNGRDLQPLHKRNVFHVNPSRHLDVPLLPIKNIWGCFCSSQAKACESSKSAGDVVCHCDKRTQAQEELEVKQDSCSRQDAETAKGNGILKQTVYVQQATVHTIPTLPMNYPEVRERKTGKYQNIPFEKVNGSRISQSCCFLSLKGNERGKRKRIRRKRKSRFDSIATLSNLIFTLEALKSETYKKLQKIESINDKAKEMKSSCENLKERHWMHRGEEIVPQQRMFTIKSSQCCFSELKKLTKDHDINRLAERKTFLGAEEGKPLLFRMEESEFSNFLKSNTLMGKSNHLGSLEVDSRSFELPKKERLSKDFQKLIRNFFEDIRESDEAEMNLKKNLQVKKLEKYIKQKSNSEMELNKSASGEYTVAKKMINLDPIRKKFFMEVKADEKSRESERVKSRDKKKGFFKISLKAFEGKENKKEKKSLLNYSPMAWLNKRLNLLSDTSPIISLRMTDFELKSGNITSILKKKSVESIVSIKAKNVASKERIRTEVANFISESYVSEYSDKQTKLSKRNRTRATGFIHRVETSSDVARSDLSFMRVIKDFDASDFFVRLGKSVDFSSACSAGSDENGTTILRRDLWRGDIPSIAEFQKLESKRGSYKMESAGKKSKDFHRVRTLKNYSGRICPITGSGIFICNEDKKKKKTTVEVKMRKPSETRAVKFRDVSVDTTEEKLIERPKRKKLKLEWKCKNLEVQSKQSSSEIHTISYVEANYRNMSFAESECQADLSTHPAAASNSTEDTVSIDPTAEESEISHSYMMPSYLSTSIGSLTREEKTSPTDNNIDTHTANENEALEKFSRLLSDKDILISKSCGEEREEFAAKPEHKFTHCDIKCTEITSEISIVPKRSWQASCEPLKDFSFEITQTVITDNSGGRFWLQNEPQFIRIEPRALSGDDRQQFVQSENVMVLHEPEIPKWNRDEEQELRSVAVLICETEDCSSPVKPNYLCQKDESYVYLSNPNLAQNRNLMVDDAEAGCDANESYTLKELDKTMLRKTSDGCPESRESESATRSLQAGAGTAKFHDRTTEPVSGGSIASLTSSVVRKHEGSSKVTEISNLRMNYYRKPFYAETLSPHKNSGLLKSRKKRHRSKKKTTSLVKRRHPTIRKFRKMSPISLDFTYLPEEEQLKIISANIAKFVREKLMDRKKLFNSENESIFSDIEGWRNAGDQETTNANAIKFKIGEITEGDRGGEKEQNREVKNAKKESKLPNEKEEREPEPEGKFTVAQRQKAVDAAGDAERKEDKNDPSRQQPDFIKLNKIMAGKYKRLPPKKNEQKSTRKEIPKETAKDAKKEEVPRAIPKPLPLGMKKQPNASGSSQTKESKMSGKTFRALSADKGRRSGIPVPRASRETSSRQKPSASSPEASSPPAKICRPVSPKENSLLAVQKQVRQKKRMIPTYTLTSYLNAPNEIFQYQRIELDVPRNDITEILTDGINGKKFDRESKAKDPLLKRNLDCLITLRHRINHEIPADAENSMQYVQTLLSHDCGGSAIVEKAPAKSSLDLLDSGRIFYLEMNERRDRSNRKPEFSGESEFRRIRRKGAPREKSGTGSEPDDDESGGFPPSAKASEGKRGTCAENLPETRVDEEATDVLEKCIYQLGGGEMSNLIANEKKALERNFSNKPLLKKRKERMLDIPKEMKRKLLSELQGETKEPERDRSAEGVEGPEEGDFAARISETGKRTCDERERKNSEKPPGDPKNGLGR